MNNFDAEIGDHITKLADPALAFLHARRLSEIGLKAIPMLCNELKRTATDPTEPSYSVNAWLVKSLRDIGSEAVPPLLELLQDPNTQVRWAAASALGKIESDEHMTTLCTTLIEESNANIRWMITSALSTYLDHPKVLKTFLQVSNDPSPYVRWVVISSLANLPQPSFNAFLTIVNALKDTDEKVRKISKAALSEVHRFFFFLYQLSGENRQLFNSLCLMLDEEFLIKKKDELF